jgi:hypothetical protein
LEGRLVRLLGVYVFEGRANFIAPKCYATLDLVSLLFSFTETLTIYSYSFDHIQGYAKILGYIIPEARHKGTSTMGK